MVLEENPEAKVLATMLYPHRILNEFWRLFLNRTAQD